jgi:thioredoxin reductase (NADPH)
VSVRDRSEIAQLHGDDGELAAVTLKDGIRLSLSFLFLFLGASPCTEWVGDMLETDEDGFVLTGAAVGGTGLLETSVSGIFAVGDVRSGSIKRCATAVGEGAMVVAHLHNHIARLQASGRPTT